jgi:8-amino-7-oxononanoate synthase
VDAASPLDPAGTALPSLLAELSRRLAEREAAGLRRALELPAGRDFTSNDYLGFARDAELAARIVARLGERASPATQARPGLGAAAARLLRGHLPEHVALEARLAAWKGCAAALLFPSGYQANLALLGALLRRQDRAISDAANHASLIDGLRLAGCHRVVVPHLDLEALEAALATPHPDGHTVVVTESLFSMDGDLAPLDRLTTLCRRYDAGLIVDDAHASGLWGAERGSGLVEHFGVEDAVTAVVSTAGKALGLAGAWIAGPRVVVDAVLNFGRGFVFSTAPPPAHLLALDAALDHLAAHPERRARVHQRAAELRAALGDHGLPTLGGPGPIVPVLVGDNHRALAVAARVRAAGFDVRAVRPPTVPAGTARLRLSVHADHQPEEIAAVAAAVAAAMAAEGGRLTTPADV